jgi:hypothetical protein
MTNPVRYACLSLLCACASISATQTFELSTSVVIPALPHAAVSVPQTVSLVMKFGSCSNSALGDLEKLRANDHVDSLDVWVDISDVELHSEATFSGVQTLTLQLVAGDEVIPVCSRALTASEQKASTLKCPFEHRVRAEQLCATLGSEQAPAQMTIEVQVLTDDVRLTTIGAKIQVVTELAADLSL